ncbi:hypothetical protein B5S32_g2525 [[Candida] boidinii]|nr:hypothetical protein B5S32_g2525 [[Candida] boidinii]
MASAECSSVSAAPLPATSSTTSDNPLPSTTETVTPQMSGCTMQDTAQLTLYQGAIDSDYSDTSTGVTVYKSVAYFKPDEAGSYVFQFTSGEYNPVLFVGDDAFDCFSVFLS